MRTSLQQVAKRAGVSSATVSRILNDVDISIASETRKRVLHIAAELNYQPNRAARALATGRTQTLAMWIANLRSSYYSRLIYQAREEILRHEYDLMISGAKSRPDRSLDTSRVLSWPVDGVLAVDLPRGTIPGMEKSLLQGKPFITLGAYVTPDADFVCVDFTAQATEAVRHLAAGGRRRIAYLVPGWFEWFRQCRDGRLYGYEAAMAELGREPEYIITAWEARRDIAPLLTAYIEQHGHPDALFCYNDDMAIGALRTLCDLGLHVPDDVAIIGCDGIEETIYANPRLSTIVQPLEELCATAWTFLEQRIQEPSLPLQQMTLQPRLEIRASSSPEMNRCRSSRVDDPAE